MKFNLEPAAGMKVGWLRGGGVRAWMELGGWDVRACGGGHGGPQTEESSQHGGGVGRRWGRILRRGATWGLTTSRQQPACMWEGLRGGKTGW